MKLPAAILLALSLSGCALHEPTPFKWSAHTSVPDQISNALVAGQVAAALIEDWGAPDRKRAYLHDACATGATLLATEAIKRAFPRWRPNQSDQKSFPSMHTGVAASLADYSPAWGASITLGVAWGRMASGFHFGSDVLAGAAIGTSATLLCPK